eukprot:scaffold2974_cov404-Prasinococcus_capsulatus_cf.AAC.5
MQCVREWARNALCVSLEAVSMLSGELSAPLDPRAQNQSSRHVRVLGLVDILYTSPRHRAMPSQMLAPGMLDPCSAPGSFLSNCCKRCEDRGYSSVAKWRA